MVTNQLRVYILKEDRGNRWDPKLKWNIRKYVENVRKNLKLNERINNSVMKFVGIRIGLSYIRGN